MALGHNWASYENHAKNHVSKSDPLHFERPRLRVLEGILAVLGARF